ncbi:MAG: hypothetical protein QOK24_1389 [Verrucomicrobiota bacterium]|jgi:tetratricopeptide (TPR) repeat protein
MKNFGLIIALLCGAAGTLLAEADPAFAKANQAYSEGRFQEAVDGYQSLVQAGSSSANLFYDLGNAWFRLGNFGEAILNYERALALEPRHPESEANLQLARDESRALELRKTPAEKYLEAGTPTQYSIAASVAFWFAMFATARPFFARRRSAGPIALIILSLLVFAGASFALYTQENGSKGSALAIVTGKDIQARLATAESAGSVLALPPGSEIKLLSERGDWIYAALPNDLRGWIPAKAVQRVRL